MRSGIVEGWKELFPRQLAADCCYELYCTVISHAAFLCFNPCGRAWARVHGMRSTRESGPQMHAVVLGKSSRSLACHKATSSHPLGSTTPRQRGMWSVVIHFTQKLARTCGWKAPKLECAFGSKELFLSHQTAV